MEALEHGKYLLKVFLVDTDSIILDLDTDHAVFHSMGTDSYQGRYAITAELHSIGDKVLQ